MTSLTPPGQAPVPGSLQAMQDAHDAALEEGKDEEDWTPSEPPNEPTGGLLIPTVEDLAVVLQAGFDLSPAEAAAKAFTMWVALESLRVPTDARTWDQVRDAIELRLRELLYVSFAPFSEYADELTTIALGEREGR